MQELRNQITKTMRRDIKRKARGRRMKNLIKTKRWIRKKRKSQKIIKRGRMNLVMKVMERINIRKIRMENKRKNQRRRFKRVNLKNNLKVQEQVTVIVVMEVGV